MRHDDAAYVAPTSELRLSPSLHHVSLATKLVPLAVRAALMPEMNAPSADAPSVDAPSANACAPSADAPSANV